jgi:hypothetical protein
MEQYHFTLYNDTGVMTFKSYNTNDQTRVDEAFDANGALSQTTVYHIDSELEVVQSIVFKGAEMLLMSIEDRYRDGRVDVFKADEQGKLKLQKQNA